MKKSILYLIAFLNSIFYLCAQSNNDSVDLINKNSNQADDKNKIILTVVEHMPQFNGGEKKLAEYLSDNMIYPVEAQKNGVEGVVYARFIVNELGEIQDATIVRGISKDYDEEILRILKNMPKWIPGKQNGKLVPVSLTMPFRFKLMESRAEDSLIFTVVEQMPEFPGGKKALRKFLKKNVIYPQEGSKRNIDGNVYLSFVIDKEGGIRDILLLKGLNKECDEEAIRVVKEMPKWIPGKQGGKPVLVRISLGVEFKVQ